MELATISGLEREKARQYLIYVIVKKNSNTNQDKSAGLD
jgi:hypothetical protein